MVKEKVYLESSVISYLTARPATDVIKLAKQKLTQQWWDENRSAYDLYVSDPVIAEIQRGNPEAAHRRMAVVAGLPILDVNATVVAFYRQFFSRHILPSKAESDALHIAVAAVHGMSYLVTWNCTHINNATLKRKISEVIAKAGYNAVVMATPEELWRIVK